MIPVTPSPEPGDFDRRVRRPGSAFLSVTPSPTKGEWDDHAYWRAVLPDLRSSYNNLCAYSSSHIRSGNSRDTESVDHFRPRSIYPQLAYEWENYRLCRVKMNGYKGCHEDVLDPFTIPNGWFRLNFDSFLLVPDPTLNKQDKGRVLATINRLRLNSDAAFVAERIEVIKQHCLGQVTWEYICGKYPFIAAEMQRQNFDIAFLPNMRHFFRARRNR